MPYGFYLTDKGRELIDKAIVDGEKVNIVKACFGSGGNPETERDYSITELKEQFYEKTLSPDLDAYQVDENDPYSLLIRSVVPDEVTGTFNEIGYKDDQDNLIIYGVVQERVKTSGVQGGMNRIQYENWVRLENGDIDKIEIKINSPEYDKVEQLLEKIEKEFNIDNYVTQDQLTDVGSLSLYLVVKASEGYEGKIITAKSKVDGSVYTGKVESGVVLIKVKTPGEYELTNDLNDNKLTAVVGETLVDEVHFTEFEGTINVSIPEMLIGETIQAVNGEHSVEKLAETTSVAFQVEFEGSWEVSVKGTEYIAKQTVELSKGDSTKSCTLTAASGVPYITVTLAPEFVGSKIVCKKDTIETKKESTSETIQFLIKELGQYTISLEESEHIQKEVNVNSAKEFKTELTLDDTTVPILIVTSKEEDNGKTIKAAKGGTELTKVMKNRRVLFVLTEQGTWTVSCSDYPENNKTIEINSNKAFKLAYRATIFGIKVTQSESDPKQRITEKLEDLKGLTPITVNTQDGTVDYGDMKDQFLFEALNHVVLKSIDKSEEIELNPNDYSQKLDGSPAPNATLTSNYNTFARADKLYIYQYDKDGYEYYYISDEKVDDNYSPIGFINESGEEIDHSYLGSFLGCYDQSNRLRSVSGINIRNYTSYTDFYAAAGKCGTGYYIETHPQINLYEIAYLMMVQNFDSQTAIGQGRSLSGGSSSDQKTTQTTGFANNKGPIAYDTESKAIKFMHIEDLWGNGCYTWEAGVTFKNSKTYVRMQPPYPATTDSSGTSTYTEVTGAAATSGSISASTANNKWGRIPSAVAGSSSTYECDTFNPGSGDTQYACHRGINGLFNRAISPFSYSTSNYVARLSLLP